MRRILAAALTAAALAATPATATGTANAGTADGCLDPLLAPSAPRFVYYNPEIGFYYVDVAGAQAFASSLPGRAVTLATCLV